MRAAIFSTPAQQIFSARPTSMLLAGFTAVLITVVAATATVDEPRAHSAFQPVAPVSTTELRLESTLVATPPPRLVEQQASGYLSPVSTPEPRLVLLFGTGPAPTTLQPTDALTGSLASQLGFTD